MDLNSDLSSSHSRGSGTSKRSSYNLTGLPVARKQLPSLARRAASNPNLMPSARINPPPTLAPQSSAVCVRIVDEREGV